MKSKLLQRILSLLLIPLFFLTANLCGTLLMPVRQDHGCVWESYLEEDPGTIDLLFFGSSLVYCDVVPSVIYENTGIASYVMAGPVMTIPITYYYIREACKTQSPQMIALDINGLFFPEYTDYTKSTIGYMPWSQNRLAATFTAAEPESRLGLLFPLYNYHGRIASAPLRDVLGHLNPQADPYAGYTPLNENKPLVETTAWTYQTGTEDYRRNLEYLQKISSFCQEEGIGLLLYASPAQIQIPGDIMEEMLRDISGIAFTAFLDFNDYVAEISIDDSRDWYDGLHLNVTGAVKFSRFLSALLSDSQWVTPGGTADAALWESRAAALADYTASGTGS